INRADQISDNNVVFGHRGGTLNLNGTNLEFKDIYHMDKDAKISNEKSDKKSTFTFKPKSDKRVFLGSFKGKLDLVYNPDDNNSEWSIRSEDTNIEGDF
ncbi:S6 family peptidase, partial [Streptobacillus moniliformis]